jgi:hypothetical protein
VDWLLKQGFVVESLMIKWEQIACSSLYTIKGLGKY